jgi:tetratricopeptide (TPR) repeat protein
MDMGHSLPPDGHFIGWTPGKMPSAAVPGMAWRLDRGTDVVLQVHLLPSGKPEEIRPSIGFHFADAPPTIRPSIAGLYIENIEIPPFERNHRREDRFTLPVPVDVIGVYPHAHYLGKSMSAHAELPDGSSVSLIRIDDWDFNWQDDYQYVKPVSLPADSTIVLEWIYDNSEDNIRNPNYPPKTVRSGNQSSDEMGSLALQVLARNDHDRALLAEARARDILDVLPDSWPDLNNLGNALQDQGRIEEAIPHYRRALELQPQLDDARYNLGIALMELGRTDQAIAAFREVLRLNPDHARAHNNIGNALVSRGRTEDAVEEFLRAIALEPSLEVARYNLGNAMLALERYDEAAERFREALTINPRYAMAHNNLGTVLHLQGRLHAAIPAYEAALAIEPDNVEAHTNLGIALAATERTDEAIRHFRSALAIDPDYDLARTNLEAARQGR